MNHDFIHPFVQAVSPAVLASLGASTVVLLVALVIATAKRDSARTRYNVLLSAFVFAALPAHIVFGAALFYQQEITGLFARKAEPKTAQVVAGGVTGELPVVTRPGVDWECPLLGLISLISFVLIGRVVLRATRRPNFLAVETRSPSDETIAAAREVQSALRLHEPTPLAITPAAAAPAVLGIRRPVLVLPDTALQRLSSDELRAVLGHELAHVARRDNLTSLLQALIAAVYWFNPLVWIVNHRISVEREQACDEIALEIVPRRETFINALTTLSHATLHSSHPRLSCISGSGIRERLENIMNLSELSSSLRSKLLALTAPSVLGVLMAVGIGLAVDRPLIALEQKSAEYLLQVEPKPSKDNIVVFDIAIREAASGRVVSGPRIQTRIGQSASIRSTVGDRRFDVEITFSDDKSGRARLMVFDNGVLASDMTKEFTIGQDEKYTGEPIDLMLKDADPRDVFRVFSQITGIEFAVDPTITTKITCSYDNVPWDQVLDELAAENGMEVKIEGKVVRITHRTARAPVSNVRTGLVTDPRAEEPPMVMPKVVRRVEPLYPAEAKAQNVQGTVIVEVEIDETGKLVGARPVKRLPAGLTEAAIEAVKQWQFEPALLDGKPIATKLNLTIAFRLP